MVQYLISGSIKSGFTAARYIASTVNARVQLFMNVMKSFLLESAFVFSWLQDVSKTILFSPMGWIQVWFFGRSSLKSANSPSYSSVEREALYTADNKAFVFALSVQNFSYALKWFLSALEIFSSETRAELYCSVG